MLNRQLFLDNQTEKMSATKCYNEFGIKFSRFRISLRFPATSEATPESSKRTPHEDEPYWEFQRVSADGSTITRTPITITPAEEDQRSASTSSERSPPLPPRSSPVPPPPVLPPRGFHSLQTRSRRSTSTYV